MSYDPDEDDPVLGIVLLVLLVPLFVVPFVMAASQ